MQAKRKFRYQSGTSRGLFASYMAVFQWRNSHKEKFLGCYSVFANATRKLQYLLINDCFVN